MAVDKNIRVTPDEVQRTARNIEADNIRYRDSYTNVFNASDMILRTWAGRDTVAYYNRLNEFRGVLTQMEVLVGEYIAFLDRSALAYRETQDGIESRAHGLPVS